jgi:hypothetical protein
VFADGQNGAGDGNRAAQEIATRGEVSRIRLVRLAPELGYQQENLREAENPTLTSLQKERLNMSGPMKTAIPGFPDSRLGTVGSAR